MVSDDKFYCHYISQAGLDFKKTVRQFDRQNSEVVRHFYAFCSCYALTFQKKKKKKSIILSVILADTF